MSRMFLVDGKPMTTWNVWVGCRFNCRYCNARQLAETRLKESPRYREGFKPHLIEEELSRHNFKPGQWIFVGYMGDISFAPVPVMERIFAVIKQFPDTNFLFCTKDPWSYRAWLHLLTPNCVIGATIPTNLRDFSKAPPTWDRTREMIVLQWPRKFVSIEPVMEFAPSFSGWILAIEPELVEIGADNYHNELPEPSWERVQSLIGDLSTHGVKIVQKTGLTRLRQQKVNKMVKKLSLSAGR